MSKAVATAPAHKVAPNAITAINRFHRAATASAVQMAVYAALCGMELLKARKFVAHGGWAAFMEANCSFSDVTAIKYMKLAEAVKGRMVKSEPDSDLLALAPSELTSDQQAKLLELVAQATDGGTISSLYQEYGIVRRVESSPAGGYKVNEALVQTFLRRYHAPLEGTKYADLPAEVQEHYRRWIRQSDGDGMQMSLDFYAVTVSRFDEFATKRAEIIDNMPDDELNHFIGTLEEWLADAKAKRD